TPSLSLLSFPTRRSSDLLDASALVKLVVAEPESDVLRHFLATGADGFSSRIAMVEVYRAVQRQAEVDAAGQVEAVLAGIDLIERSEEHTSELQSRFDLVC